MEPEFRFDDPRRWQRMVMAFATVVVGTAMSIGLAISGAVAAVLAGPLPICFLRGARELIDGLIATVWYVREIIMVNWKD